MRGYGFIKRYGVDDFPEIDNPKTVYIFERGSFVETDNDSEFKYGSRETTLKELEQLYGELLESKEFE